MKKKNKSYAMNPSHAWPKKTDIFLVRTRTRRLIGFREEHARHHWLVSGKNTRASWERTHIHEFIAPYDLYTKAQLK